MLVLERREVHMATVAMVVRYFTDGRIDVTAEQDGVENRSLVQTVKIQPELLQRVKIPPAPNELRQEVLRNHSHQSEINDSNIREVQDWTFIVGSNTCVDKLINGEWKRICS